MLHHLLLVWPVDGISLQGEGAAKVEQVLRRHNKVRLVQPGIVWSAALLVHLTSGLFFRLLVIVVEVALAYLLLFFRLIVIVYHQVREVVKLLAPLDILLTRRTFLQAKTAFVVKEHELAAVEDFPFFSGVCPLTI